MAEGVARDSSPSDAISRQEALERFETLNSSVERILNMLSSQGFSAAQATASGPSAQSGACTSGAEQEGHNHPASAPSFLQLSQDSVSAVLPAQRSFANLAHSQSNMSPVATEVPVSTDAGGIPVNVSSALPPVPSYLVAKINEGKFLDFILLRRCNLKKLPTVEPSPIQLSKMIRSELSPVRGFVDWAEAWAVYTGVLASYNPSKIKDLIGYFLLLATASREVPLLGWLDYDKAFRKLAEDDPSVSWGEASPTLWVTTVITKGSLQGPRDPPVSQGSNVSYFFRWNNGFCPNNVRCRFVHQCSICKGKHPKVYCTSMPSGGGGLKLATPSTGIMQSHLPLRRSISNLLTVSIEPCVAAGSLAPPKSISPFER